MNNEFTQPELIAASTYLTTSDNTDQFVKSRNDWLFESKDTCKKILDVLV